jgi:hypothetical protein
MEGSVEKFKEAADIRLFSIFAAVMPFCLMK